MAALLLARQVGELTNEQVTVFNGDGRAGAKLLAALDFRPKRLRMIDRRLSYADYLREVSRHKIVLQLDTSFVPGQVAGDALLCQLPSVGGNGAIDRLAFSETCGFGRSIADIEEERFRMSEMACDRTKSRSLLGTLNDFSFGARVHFIAARHESLEDIARDLAAAGAGCARRGLALGQRGGPFRGHLVLFGHGRGGLS